MYERILVALGGSPCSVVALRHATQLALAQGSKLRLLHVINEVGPNVGHPRIPEKFWKAKRRAGKRILNSAKSRAAKSGAEAEAKMLEIATMGTLVRHIPEVIVKEAERWPADLVVIGTHGGRGLNRFLLGSVADGVLRRSSVPVLLVRGKTARP